MAEPVAWGVHSDVVRGLVNLGREWPVYGTSEDTAFSAVEDGLGDRVVPLVRLSDTEELVEALREIAEQQGWSYDRGSYGLCDDCRSRKGEAHDRECTYDIARRALAAYEGGERDE